MKNKAKKKKKGKESVAVFMPKGRCLKLARQQMTQNKFKAKLEWTAWHGEQKQFGGLLNITRVESVVGLSYYVVSHQVHIDRLNMSFHHSDYVRYMWSIETGK